MSVVDTDSIGAAEQSTYIVLRALTRQVWPKITALPPEDRDRIPQVVMDLLRGVMFAGAHGVMPHEHALSEAIADQEWAEALNTSMRGTLDRVAALSDQLHAAKGALPLFRYNRSGNLVRDYGVDVDRIEEVLRGQGQAFTQKA